MNRIPTLFLQAVVVLIGIGAFVFLLWEPHLEGRNAGATLFEIYFNDLFLAYVYTGSVAFFTALYQVFQLLRYVRQNEAFSKRSVRAVQIIKYCALTLVLFIVGAEAYFFMVRRDEDDIAGGVAAGIFLMFASLVIAACVDVLEGLLRSTRDAKLSND